MKTPFVLPLSFHDCGFHNVGNSFAILDANGIHVCAIHRHSVEDNPKARAAFLVQCVNACPELVRILSDGIETEGFSLSGPTDIRAAEHGESAWVCGARAAIAKATA